jgi:hypothetical protein
MASFVPTKKMFSIENYFYRNIFLEKLFQLKFFWKINGEGGGDHHNGKCQVTSSANGQRMTWSGERVEAAGDDNREWWNAREEHKPNPTK